MERVRLKEIAEGIGISVAMVSMLISGKRKPSWELSKKLSEIYGRDASWWMEAGSEKIGLALREKDGGKNGAGSGSRRNGKRRAA